MWYHDALEAGLINTYHRHSVSTHTSVYSVLSVRTHWLSSWWPSSLCSCWPLCCHTWPSLVRLTELLELIHLLTNILTALSCFLSSCECGYSEWHRCKTTLQTLHGFCSKELATYLWWIPHFWWVCLDCRTLSKEVECIVWKCTSWNLIFYSLKYKTEC